MIGQEMHDLMRQLFPICRSLTGDGNRETLANLRRHIPLKMYEVASGTKCFDWVVPDEWNLRGAFLEGSGENEVLNLAIDGNLCVVGYSEPKNELVALSELQPHLHSLAEWPSVIPYVTSYYERNWGFCLPEEKRKYLVDGKYHAYIDSTLEPGYLTYADLVIPGRSEKEVLISTYICHPSLANDNLSGPVVSTFLAKWLLEEPRRFTYRFVFIPETIGSIVYLSRHLDHLKRRVIAGFQVTCVGDDREYSLLPSRLGFSYSDLVAQHVLGECRHYSWTERGSDERQWCAPGVDLPVTSVMRSKYATFPEYHTSLDNLDLVTPRGLEGGYNALKECIRAIEDNYCYYATHLGEPQMGRRGLYAPENMDFLTYCDGRSLLEIAEVLGRPISELKPIAEEMLEHGLVGREE